MMKEKYIILFSNGVEYTIPVMTIAKHRAAHYAHEFDNDEERSLKEDTIPLFEGDAFEIIDWARNNMNWPDVSNSASAQSREIKPNWEEEWSNNSVRLL